MANDQQRISDILNTLAVRIAELNAEIEQRHSQIRDLEAELHSLVSPPLRSDDRQPHPLRGTIGDVGADVAIVLQRARLNAQIDLLAAELSARQDKLRDAERERIEARLNLDQTARNYERNRCDEFLL